AFGAGLRATTAKIGVLQSGNEGAANQCAPASPPRRACLNRAGGHGRGSYARFTPAARSVTQAGEFGGILGLRSRSSVCRAGASFLPLQAVQPRLQSHYLRLLLSQLPHFTPEL